MKNLQYYQFLPEKMCEDSIKTELIYFFQNDYIDKYEQLQILDELAIRQWNTYSLIESNLRNKIDEFLIQTLDFSNEELVDIIIHISVAFGLVRTYNFILQNIPNIKDQKILNLINEYKQEIKDISNPYISLYQ